MTNSISFVIRGAVRRLTAINGFVAPISQATARRPVGQGSTPFTGGGADRLRTASRSTPSEGLRACGIPCETGRGYASKSCALRSRDLRDPSRGSPRCSAGPRRPAPGRSATRRLRPDLGRSHPADKAGGHPNPGEGLAAVGGISRSSPLISPNDEGRRGGRFGTAPSPKQ